MLTRMRSVVTGEKLTVRITRPLPTTVPCVTQARPFQVCTLKLVIPYRVNRHGRGRLHRARVVVLQRDDHDVVDRLLAAEDDLHPVGERIAGGVVPATAARTPARTGAIAVVDRAHRKGRTVGARRGGHTAVRREGHVDAGGRVDPCVSAGLTEPTVVGVAAVSGDDAVAAHAQHRGRAGRLRRAYGSGAATGNARCRCR